MRGLLFAVLFCAVSLAFAEAMVTILVNFSIIQPHEFDEVHGVIMFILLAVLQKAGSPATVVQCDER